MSAHAACLWVTLEGEWMNDFERNPVWRYPWRLSHRASLCRVLVFEAIRAGHVHSDDEACPF